MKTIGILGGMGPQATMDLEARIHKVSQQLIPQDVNRGYPPLAVYYVRRAPMVLNPDGSVREPLEPDPELLAAAQRLGSLVDLLVIGSNTAHLFEEKVAAAAGKPVISLVAETLTEAQNRAVKGRYLFAGVLAVGETLRRGLYLNALLRKGYQVATPRPGSIEKIDAEVWALMEGKEVTGTALRDEIAAFRQSGVQAIILGCTEFPMLLGKDADASDLINPNQLVAEAAVRRALA